MSITPEQEHRAFNRKLLKDSMKGLSEYSAHLSYLLCVLNSGRKELKNVLRACSKQGFTPSDTREALRRFNKCGLVEYRHVSLSIYVELTGDGREFAQEVGNE